MDISNKEILELNVLNIEDEENHAETIKMFLSSYGFKVHHFTTLKADDEKLLEYMVMNPDTKIIIVDRLLTTSKEPDMEEGLRLVEEIIWPLDRTAFFVVFSQYTDNPRLPIYNKVEPHWTFIPKEFEVDRKTLTKNCLNNLLTVLQHCKNYSSPIFETPQYDSYTWTKEIHDFADRRKADLQINRSSDKVIINAIIESTKVLNELSLAAMTFSKAGEPSKKISIGIYGSCGRLEKRDSSDIECSIYCTKEYGGSPVTLAVTFWNRIKTYMEMKNWKYEGKAKVEKNQPKMLTISQATEDLGNSFQAVFYTNELIATEPEKRPHLRNKHWQVLTELRPIFNPYHIFNLKKELIRKNVGKPDKYLIAKDPYFHELSEQFKLDQGPKSLDDNKGWKRFCYRLLNILAFRLALIGDIQFSEKDELDNDEDWKNFMNLLCQPGVIKVLWFANKFTHHFIQKTTENPKIKEIQKKLDELGDSYLRVMSLFIRYGDQIENSMKSDAKDLLKKFIDLFNNLEKFKPFAKTLEIKWLYSTEYLSNLADEL